MSLPAFAFGPAGRILFGRGRAAEAPDLARALGTRIALVRGASPDRAAFLADGLARAGVPHVAIACPGEPDLPGLLAALDTVRAFGANAVVGLGGGSVVDLAKAIAALAPAPGDPMDHLEVVGRGLPLAAAPLPMLAVPTTAGTGAEVTRNAVIAVPEHRRKVSLRDERMIPTIALVDPALTDGAPRAVTLASGLDALTQVIEPYLSARANPMTDALCRDAIPRALPALRTLMRGEDASARDSMAFVSLCGGLALAHAGLGVVHGLAGPIGGVSGAPHGAVCGALLAPSLLALRAKAQAGSTLARRLAEVDAHVAAAFEVSPAEAPDALAAFARDNGLPSLSALGVAADDHAGLAAMANASSSMKASPVRFEEAALVDLMRAAG